MEFAAGMEQSASGLPREGPAWLPQLLRTEFFGHCKKHQTGKHEKNQFCLSCCSGPYCPEGLHQLHPGHASVQVRKASHRDVVRIADIQKYLDIGNIQAYTINSAKIVFLQSRPQPKLCKGAPKYCDTCHRSLADQVKFCSINCKLVAIHGNHDPDPALTLSPSADSWSVPGFSGRANSGDGHSHLAPSVSDGHEGAVDSVNHDTSTSALTIPPTPRKQGKRGSPGLELPPSKRRRNSEDGGCPLSPMSVLGSGTAFAHDWLHGPSTPDSHEELSPRMHPRKQFHPARAPFF